MDQLVRPAVNRVTAKAANMMVWLAPVESRLRRTRYASRSRRYDQADPAPVMGVGTVTFTTAISGSWSQVFP